MTVLALARSPEHRLTVGFHCVPVGRARAASAASFCTRVRPRCGGHREGLSRPQVRTVEGRSDKAALSEFNAQSNRLTLRVGEEMTMLAHRLLRII